MWRKQEETKNSSPEHREPVRVEPSAPVSAPPVVATPAPSLAVSVREAAPPSGHLTSTLVIKGEITGREDLYIDGEVQGKIRLEEGRLTVGPRGRVAADVEAREIVIRGRVNGNLQGRDRVEIGQTGCATGDVVTQRILIEDGAEIHGRVEIKRVEARRPAQAEQKPAAAASAGTAPVSANGPSGKGTAKQAETTVETRESAPVA